MVRLLIATVPEKTKRALLPLAVLFAPERVKLLPLTVMLCVIAGRSLTVEILAVKVIESPATALESAARKVASLFTVKSVAKAGDEANSETIMAESQ